jgi:hypothetical protein
MFDKHIFNTNNTIQSRIIERQMDEKIRYMEKNCILINNLQCKKKWKQISALHMLSKQLNKKEM